MTVVLSPYKAGFILEKSEVTSEHPKSPERQVSVISPLFRRKNRGTCNCQISRVNQRESDTTTH